MKKYLLVLVIFIGAAFYSSTNKKVVTIGILTDIQYCDCDDKGNRNYRASLSKLEESINYFNHNKPDFIAHLGDVIDHKFSSYDSVLKRFSKSLVPVNFVLGNHEFDVNKEHRKDVSNKLGLKNSYYSKTYGDWQILFLNGDELNKLYPGNKKIRKETEEIYKSSIKKNKCNFFSFNSGISTSQLEWIKSELDKASRSGKKVIMMCHFPIYPFACHNLRTDDELLDLISKYKCVKAYFCGHNHKGGYGFKDGVHYINFRGMIESGNEPAFAFVTLTEDSIFVEGHGSEPSRILKIYQ
jgi:manganese-dependent ADP-ribose/CDP-alcohol diphosphatase